MKKIISIILLLSLVVLMFSSCNKEDKEGLYGTHHVEMTFKNYGTIKLELYGDIAPITVKNFIELVRSGYYDGLTIIRVQPGFVIQGGDGPDVPAIKGEFLANGVENNLSHSRGVISMARTSVYDSATSQFFICLSDDCRYSLDYLYAGFGIVTEGMDVVDAIVNGVPNEAFLNNMGFLASEYEIVIEYAKVID